MFRLHITAAQRRLLVAILLALGLAFAFPAASEAHAGRLSTLHLHDVRQDQRAAV